MKQTNINIDDIKRFPTVTNPIKADDLHTPQAYAYTLRRAIVTDCTTEQRAELVKLLEGKDTAEGVTFNNTRVNRDRLHIWQNEQSRKERAAILGEGWEYVSGLHHHTKPGNLVTCLDGTRGRVTKASGESCVIEFETEDGRRLSVAGYFRKSGQFFTPGTRYRCIKSVKMNDKKRTTAFTTGRTYEQASEPTAWSGWLTNDGGESHGWPQPANIAKTCEVWDMKPENADPRNYFEPVREADGEPVTQAEGIKIGDTVRHNKHEEVATVTDIREAFVNRCDGYRYLYTLDFGQSVTGPFGVELNGGEFLREAFTPCTPDGRDLLPEPPAEIELAV